MLVYQRVYPDSKGLPGFMWAYVARSEYMICPPKIHLVRLALSEEKRVPFHVRGTPKHVQTYPSWMFIYLFIKKIHTHIYIYIYIIFVYIYIHLHIELVVQYL